ncbi:MAG: flagellar hook-basal body protein [Phycisphaerales bacterium JB063]
MNYGMHVAASGVLVNSHRLDVLANNLANVNTPGFKPQFSDVQERLPERLEDGPYEPGVARRMLEQIGGGVYASQHQTNFEPGSLVQTGQDLDVALDSNDTFFVVQARDEKTGELSPHVTRDGRFQTNHEGEIVTGSGARVLDGGDQPIRVPNGTTDIRISQQGDIQFYDKAENSLGQARLQVARVDTAGLEHRGAGLFAMVTGDTRQAVDTPVVHQGSYEGSGTNAITTMMEIVAATKAASGNANMIRYHDQMMNQSINTFARLA